MNVERVLDSLNIDGIRSTLNKHYHDEGPGREPIDPLAMLKSQLLKHLLQIPSDRRLAIRLRRNRRLAKACGFQCRRTPSHGLFTQRARAEEPWTTSPAEATPMRGSGEGGGASYSARATYIY